MTKVTIDISQEPALQNATPQAEKPSHTELVFILDRSGSMGGLETDTIGGFNATLAKHREAEGEANVTTVLFDDKIERLHDRISIEAVSDITSKEYYVRGCTALLDAVGSTIKHVESIQKYQPEGYKADKVIFVITTDGLENASREYSYEMVKRLIEQRKEAGWEFFFLGANIDAVGEAAKIGISANRAVKYISDSVGTRAMYESFGDASVMARCCEASIGGEWKEAVEEDVASRGL